MELNSPVRRRLPSSATLGSLFYGVASLVILFLLAQVFVPSVTRSAAGTLAGQGRSTDAAAPIIYGEYSDRQQYSSLNQIDTTNVKNLRVAWTYALGERGKSFQATPLVVGNAMYFPTPDSKVIALDAMTGKELWKTGAEPIIIPARRSTFYREIQCSSAH